MKAEDAKRISDRVNESNLSYKILEEIYKKIDTACKLGEYYIGMFDIQPHIKKYLENNKYLVIKYPNKIPYDWAILWKNDIDMSNVECPNFRFKNEEDVKNYGKIKH